MKCLYVVLALLLQNATPELIQNLPPAPGAYYLRNDTGWVRLTKAPIADIKSKDLDMFVMTGGYIDFEIQIECSGAAAETRFAFPRPVFFIRGSGSLKDLMLIRLSTKKNKRTCQMVSSDATVENKGGFNQKDIYKMKITQYPNRVFSATPEEDLRPGEYLLFLGNTASSYDFGVD